MVTPIRLRTLGLVRSRTMSSRTVALPKRLRISKGSISGEVWRKSSAQAPRAERDEYQMDGSPFR